MRKSSIFYKEVIERHKKRENNILALEDKMNGNGNHWDKGE